MHGPSAWDFFGFGELRRQPFLHLDLDMNCPTPNKNRTVMWFHALSPRKGDHQDPAQRERGIYGIGGFLAVTKEMRILWSPPYLSRSSPELCVGHLPCPFDWGISNTLYGLVCIIYIYMDIIYYLQAVVVRISSCASDYQNVSGWQVDGLRGSDDGYKRIASIGHRSHARCEAGLLFGSPSQRSNPG